MRQPVSSDATGSGGEHVASLGEQTRAQILDAAEHLFAERGPEAVSIRAIAAHANVNLSAVNYHFGTKQKLFEELFRRLAVPINEERLRLLDASIAAAREGAPSIEEVMTAFIAPPLRLVAEASGSARALVIMQFLFQGFSRPGEVSILETYYEPVRSRFVAVIQDVLPHLTIDDILWRYNYVVGCIIYAMGGATRMTRLPRSIPGQHNVAPVSGDDAIRHLVLFSSAGFLAPSAGRAKSDGRGAARGAKAD